MRRRIGIVTDAALDVLTAQLAEEMRWLPRYDIDRIASAQAEALRAAGFRITAPAAALAPAQPATPGDTP
ncbi:hypothetical protein [Streptomyces stelliscabiei]|uniref:hypothetical protein n=1 Tax=Streptomyces stelliscabiei TaxID=146820 RepID=UPI0029A988BD|nr:hypothetical protein [Streptomyces stelliscabiei]MDX2667425.1 hypothetical protein [Streptomyces stelliscabiei]MDX2785964.1 hypothetical protein [Streptomyces stelliscabiei]